MSTVGATKKGSQSYIEKRRGRLEIEVIRSRRGVVKRTETDLASNKFPKCSPQTGIPKEIHRVSREEKGEEEIEVTSFQRQWLSFRVPGVLCQRSEVVLWNLLNIQMIF